VNAQQTPHGPLKLPPARNPEQGRIARRLRGHATSDQWLPEGLAPELDALRAEQLRLRGQVAAELASLSASAARFHAEDEDHRAKLRQAHRDGDTAPVEDLRTPADARQAEARAIEERVWAGAAVLAEVADSVIVWVREHEDDLLGDLLGRLGPAEDKVREAHDALVAARREMWEVAQHGPYLQRLADDGAFGLQPAPTPTDPPQQFDAEQARRMLERPWYRREVEEQPVAWLEQEPERDDAIEPLDEDETGVVSGLVGEHA
jgi:hypothetical protein